MTIKYGKVVGRFLYTAPDGPDADNKPDLAGLKGTVTFTPAVTSVLSESDATTYFPSVIKASLDNDGYLRHNFREGVFLMSPTASDINPGDWTWRVSFDLRRGNQQVAFSSFDIEVAEYIDGDESTSINLTEVTPVPSSPGNAIVRGPAGDSVESVRLSEDGTAFIFVINGEDNVVEMPTISATDEFARSEIEDIKTNKADVGHTHSYDSITDKPTEFNPSAHSHGVDEVTGLTEQLAGKAEAEHSHTTEEVTGLSDALSGKADVVHTHDWDEVGNKPTTFTPSEHSHDEADITGLSDTLAGKVNKGDLVVTASFSTSNRPSATSVGAGGVIFDTTLGIPIWSNGTNWVDASGTVV